MNILEFQEQKIKYDYGYKLDVEFDVNCGYVYIYIDLSDDTVKYVGQTTNLFNRYMQHTYEPKFANKRWLVKYISIDGHYISAREKDLRNVLLDIEYMFIKHFDTMKYLNSPRTPPRKNSDRYTYLLNREFKEFVNESIRDEFSSVTGLDFSLRKIGEILPELKNLADSIKFSSGNCNEKIKLLETKLISYEEKIRNLENENSILTEKIEKIRGVI